MKRKVIAGSTMSVAVAAVLALLALPMVKTFEDRQPKPVETLSLKPAARNVGVGELLQLGISGLSLDQVHSAATTYFPRDGVTFVPAATWDSKPMLMFSAKQAGSYLVGIYAPSNTGAVVKAEQAIIVGPPTPSPSPTPVPPTPSPAAQKVWLIVVENSAARTLVQDDVEQALHQYADQSQDGRWKRLDRGSISEEDKPAKGFARFLDAYDQAGAGGPRLFIVSEATGATLLSEPLPNDKDTALALARKYGG